MPPGANILQMISRKLLELGGLFKVVKAHVVTDKVDGSRGDRDIMDGIIVEDDKERSREESASFEEDVFPRELVMQDKCRSSDRDVLFEGGNSEARVTDGDVVVDLVFIVEGPLMTLVVCLVISFLCRRRVWLKRWIIWTGPGGQALWSSLKMTSSLLSEDKRRRVCERRDKNIGLLPKWKTA